jgi:hypothetical protein
MSSTCRLVLGGMLLIAPSTADAGPAAPAKVRVQDGQSLRDIAQEQLGDPDLWTEILRVNGLTSITDVRPGVELVIPAGEIAAADRALRSALAALQRATEEGARLFAATEIETGFARYEDGVALRKAGEWTAAARAAGEAEVAAAAAIKLSAASRDAAAEARLSDREGSVEGRKPQELVWSDRERDAVLTEEERLRTLSRSSAQVTFRDDSRLRLNANSQAVIRRMRTDPLSRTEEAKVSLVEGDFYALLAGKSARKKFEVQVPEVTTDVESRNFWVRRDDSGSKFANFDDGVLRVAANGSAVDLGRNEGTLVRTGRHPSEKVGILGAVELVAPADDSQTSSAEADLRWAPVPDAVGYWLELAHDQGFQRMATSRWGLKETTFDTGPLAIGSYYWRIAALDKFGLPGARGGVLRFHVRVDQMPPFLSIQRPAEGELIRTGPVGIEGETEKYAKVRLDGAELEVDGEGKFSAEIHPKPGLVGLVLEATDAAGNRTERRRSFQYVPDEQAVLRFDDDIPQLAPRHFVTGRDVISLTGTTGPGAQLLLAVAGQQLRESTYADEIGRFTLNVPLPGADNEFVVDVVQRSGFTTRDGFRVTQDRDPPEIRLDVLPPTATSVEWLGLRGRAPGAAGLLINGRPARLIGDEFDETVTLTGGNNPIELVATDSVGNTRVERFAVHLDQTAPELIGFDVSPAQLRAGEPLEVEVEARDLSGLRKAAPFRVSVGGKEFGDFLELNGDTGTYRKTMLLPPEAVGRVALRDVEIEDYAGNKARFAFDR